MLKNAKAKLAVILIITGLIGILSIGITTIITLDGIIIESELEIVKQ